MRQRSKKDKEVSRKATQTRNPGHASKHNVSEPLTRTELEGEGITEAEFFEVLKQVCRPLKQKEQKG